MDLLSGKTIFLLSPEKWGVNYVSKHHYAHHLAQLGNTVYFLNPPVYDLPERVQIEDTERSGLKIISYRPVVRGLNRLPVVLKNLGYHRQIRIICKAAGVQPDIVWSFDPFRFQNLKAFGAPIQIYHPVDPVMIPQPTRFELEIADSATVIFATSHKILERYAQIETPTFQINHGLAGHFLEPAPEIDFSPEPGHPAVGYIGNFNNAYIDLEILLTIIRQHPEVHFYLIGPTGKSNLNAKDQEPPIIEAFRIQNNVHLLGIQPSNQLPAFLRKFDILLNTYRDDTALVARTANPHKMLEYLSTGKVVLSNYMDEYKDKRGLLVMANDNSELPGLFQEIINKLDIYNAASEQDKRRQFALSNTYQQQIKRIEKILSTLLD